MAKEKHYKELTGIFRANSKGFGFLTPDSEYAEHYPADLFVGRDDTGGAMNGDHVQAHIPPRRGERYDRVTGREKSPEAVVDFILERAVTAVIGTLERELPMTRRASPRYFVVPDNQKLASVIEIRQRELGEAREGDKVEAEITRYPTPARPYAVGRVTAVFGETESKEANYGAILCENDIRTEFPEEVLSEAERQSGHPVVPGDRADFRDKLIFTIDGADCKDMDDAISLEKTETGWLLGVHIADVSEYVREGTLLDREAFSRGTSVYFADTVVPMLPQCLSNGICSLNPGEDRYALSALISLDAEGTILDCTLAESVIRSKIRGVYSELNDIIENGESSAYFPKYAALYPDVYPEMLRLYRILEKKNLAKGALDLETVEAKIVLGDDGYPTDIVRRVQGTSEKLIEQFMLCANEAVATWLHTKGMPCVYRIHEEPPADKIQTFAAFAYQLGLDIRSLRGKTLTPADMQKVMNQAKERGMDTILSTVMLRSLSKARYSRTQSIHFGLATELYCHFTSPIRRYPDLTVHRFVKNVLHGQTQEEQRAHMELLAGKCAEQSTDCEIRAMNAERAIEDLYKVLYMQEHIGEIYDGVISSVTSFGFFVELENTCEGLVSVGSLDGFYTFDEKNLVLSCGRTQYRLGQRVRVEVENADCITRKLDFSLVPDSFRDQKKNAKEGKEHV